jgi:hypothetical protein
MATIIPTSTKNTIAICIQIQVGDMRSAYRARPWAPPGRARECGPS